MTTTARFTYGPWRRAAGAAQAALFLGLPFLRLGGESALRLDVPGGRLHAFGASFTIDEGFVVLLAALAATFAFLLGTLVLGRGWCGWSCPQTVLSDLTSWVVRGPRARPRGWRRALGFVAVAAVSGGFSAATLWYFVPPAEFLGRLAAGRLGPMLSVSWAVLFAVLVADLAVVRQIFCATVCPYARLQGVLLDGQSLVVAYDRRRSADCIDCGACVRVCPTGIDIRDGMQMECIACAACIDACQPIVRRLGRPPDLVGYFLGDPSAPGTSVRPRLLRPAALALAGATLLSAVALAAVVTRRSPLELEAHPEGAFAPRRGGDGSVVNAFEVELENRTRQPLQVTLELRGTPAQRLWLRPDHVDLAAGERRHLRVLAGARGLPPGRSLARLTGEARHGDRLIGRPMAEISLLAPEAP